MFYPQGISALGILVPGGIGARKINDQDVRPSIVVEVINKCQEIIGVAHLRIKSNGIVVCKFLLKSRPGIPIGSGDDIHDAIAIKIADGNTFGIKGAGNLRALKGLWNKRRYGRWSWSGLRR